MLCVLKRTENGILKNGAGARSIDILNSGDTLTLNLPSDEGTASAVPADIPLDIIYEDDDILVINKSPILPCTNRTITVATRCQMRWHFIL